MYTINEIVFQQVNSAINSMQGMTPEHKFRQGVRDSGESFVLRKKC